MSEPSTPSLRAAEIAAAIGGSIVGDPEVRITAIAPLDRAGPSDLSFLASAKYAQSFTDSQAGVVLVAPGLEETPGQCRTRIAVAKPHEALLALLPRLYAAPARPFTGVHPTAIIGKDVTIGADSCIEPFAVIGDGVRIGDRSWIGPHVVLATGVSVGADSRLFAHVTTYPGVRIGNRVAVHSGTRLGSDGFGYIFRNGAHEKVPHVGGCLIHDDVEIGANCTIDRGSVDDTTIGAGTKLDNLVHVGHNVRIGRLCLLLAGVAIAGSARIEDGVILAGQVGVAGHVTIGAQARIAAQAGVISSVPAGETWGGYPARPHKDSLRAQAALGKLPALLKRLERLLEREDPSA